MAYTSLAQRLTTLPLVLAGPILRRVEKKQVSVWIALKEERELKLVIYNDQGQMVLESKPRNTVKLGAHLHVLVMTAKFLPGPTELQVGQIYGYSVVSQASDLTPCDDVTYSPQRFSRPTFTLPPATLDDLRIVHGSCRKMHAPGEDAFVVLDKMLEDESYDPTTYAKARPHQLFLTGDQIYADDVAPVLLCMIKDASQVLLGWEEEINDASGQPITKPAADNASPGMRGELYSSRIALRVEDVKFELHSGREFWPKLGEPVKEVEDGCLELAFGAVEGRVNDFLAQKLPQALNQVQIRRIRR